METLALVLSGHDHSYSRTGLIDTAKIENMFRQAINKLMIQKLEPFMGQKCTRSQKVNTQKLGEDTQLYQIIDINNENKISCLQATCYEPNLLIETNS